MIAKVKDKIKGDRRRDTGWQTKRAQEKSCSAQAVRRSGLRLHL